MKIFDEDLALDELAKYQDTGIMSEKLGDEIRRLTHAIIVSAYRDRADVEDIISECMVAAIAACERFDTVRSRRLHTYLSRTISNRAIDIFRKRRDLSIEDEMLEVYGTHTYNSLLHVAENYLHAEAEASELLVLRFWPYDPDDIVHAFDVVYNVAIPTDIRGGRRGAVSLMREGSDFNQKEAMHVYYSIHFVLRLAVFNLLRHAHIAAYTRPKEDLVMTMAPEFAVAYGINDLSAALMLLRGLSIKL